jgi:membrane-associated phospholipid phosphatase
MRKRIARLISNILNPFIFSAAVLVLLSFHNTADTGEALKWVGVSLAISVVPVFIIVIWLVRRKKMDGLYDNTNHQRRIVYLLASVLGAIGCGLMWGFKAPDLLAVIFTTGFIEIVVFMGINYYWKISLHTAFAAAAVTVISLVYGVTAVWTLILLPLVAWSRIELKQHSLMQVISATLLAAGIVAAVFGGFRRL